MKNYCRVMLGKGSTYAEKCVSANFIGTDFGINQDLSGNLPGEWRTFNKEFIPVRGVIIALEDDQKIRRALAMVPSIVFYRYQISFKLMKG